MQHAAKSQSHKNSIDEQYYVGQNLGNENIEEKHKSARPNKKMQSSKLKTPTSLDTKLPIYEKFQLRQDMIKK